MKKGVVLIRNEFAQGICPSLESYLTTELNVSLSSNQPELGLYVIYPHSELSNTKLETEIDLLDRTYNISFKIIVLSIITDNIATIVVMPPSLRYRSFQIAFTDSCGIVDIALTQHSMSRLKDIVRI